MPLSQMWRLRCKVGMWTIQPHPTVVFNQAKTCHQLEAKKILQNANSEVEYGNWGGGNDWWCCCGWQCSNVMPKFYKWELLDYPNWYFVHMLKENFIDVWGQQWFEGDYFIQGLWYEKSRSSSRSYLEVLEDSPPTFVYSHLIVASKFFMPPRVKAWKKELVRQG